MRGAGLAIALPCAIALAAGCAARQPQPVDFSDKTRAYTAEDYPKVRESLKEQFSAMVAQKLGATPDSGNPLAALGSMIGLGLVNQLVDVMVRPETVMAAMTHGRMAQPAPSPASCCRAQAASIR